MKGLLFALAVVLAAACCFCSPASAGCCNGSCSYNDFAIAPAPLPPPCAPGIHYPVPKVPTVPPAIPGACTPAAPCPPPACGPANRESAEEVRRHPLLRAATAPVRLVGRIFQGMAERHAARVERRRN